MSDLFGKPAADLGIDAQIRSAEREVRMRERVYPGWVERGRMKQSAADQEIALMKAIVETLKKAREGVT